MDLSAYRIVQEALTNTLRHADAGHARVVVRYGEEHVELKVADDGRGRHRPSTPTTTTMAPVTGWGDAGAGRPVRRRAPRGRRGRRRLLGRGLLPDRTGASWTVRVVVADDQALVRAGFRMILESQPDMAVVAEAADGRDAVDAAQRMRPDVVLMDVRMPVMDGLEATRRLAGPDVAEPVRVLVLTTFDLDEYVYDALHAGASGFLLKTSVARSWCTRTRSSPGAKLCWPRRSRAG